ncbi:hypothetical protein CPC08DRAFT_821731 [Agrocybe pediades]|nr:hypothetical protein CPC08DRAFT_821731 [Agrocybe pediades]
MENMCSSASAVLALVGMVYNCLLNTIPDFVTIPTIQLSNHLNAATFVTVAATSFVSTAVICLQIWRHTTRSSRSRKHYRYQTIINILIQSSALYTNNVIFAAVLNFTSTGNLYTSYEVFLIGNFVNVTNLIIPGLAPTLMIARLFVSPSQENIEVSSVRLPSGLISGEPYATGASMAIVGADIEMEVIGSFREGEQEGEEIRVP